MHQLLSELIDSAVDNPAKAERIVHERPELLHAPYLHGGTPLHFLAVEGFLKGVQTLARLGADVNRRNDFGDSALIDVIVRGNVDMVKLLLRLGADPNTVSPDREQALHCALELDQFEIAEALIEAGASTDYETTLGETIYQALPEIGTERDRLLALIARRTA